MKTIDQKLKLLEDTKDYYNKNTKRRCKSEEKCSYSGDTLGKKSMGCAVGRLLTPKKRVELDEKGKGKKGYSTVKQVWKDLPENVKVWGVFLLTELQIFHDNGINWDKNGITESGKQSYEIIKKDIISGKL